MNGICILYKIFNQKIDQFNWYISFLSYKITMFYVNEFKQ